MAELVADILANQALVTVDDFEGLVLDGIYQIDSEYVQVRGAPRTTTLFLARGVMGTPAVAHQIGDELTPVVPAVQTSDPPTPPSLGVISQAIVTLTDEQLKALPTTQIELIPAPGEGRALMILGLQSAAPPIIGFHFNYVEDYTNVHADSVLYVQVGHSPGSRYGIQYGIGSGGGELRFLLTWGSPVSGSLPAPDGGSSGFNDGVENQPLVARVDNQSAGDLTGGDPDSFLRLVILYTVLDVT